MNFSYPVLRQYGKDVFRAYFILLKLMVPALIIVRVLDQLGFTQWLAWLLSPLMSAVGLPSELGLVWATGMLTNIYTAMVVYYELAADQPITLAQISTLGVMILVSHAIPVEGAVARLLQVPWRLTIVLRVGGGFVLGWLTCLSFDLLSLGSRPAHSVWKPELTDSDWATWGLEQLQLLSTILLILAALMAGLRILQWLGLERLLGVLLKPLMSLMQVKENAANITIVGLMLGLSFGAGLLIDEARSGRVSKRDIKVVACFLGLCHSIVEDTLLIMLLGAHVVPLLFGRLLFSCIVIWLICKSVYPPEQTRYA
ncbi:MAG: hypothetical protein C9356_08205 [Oleiphilus sp.]|nr:MAG: hypothetical protein C9356_08205 [Oleiphilus sp.]